MSTNSAKRWWWVAAGLLMLAGCSQTNDNLGGVMTGRTDTSLASVEPINVGDASEVDLVEQLALHRQSYRQHLVALKNWYLKNGYLDKAKWADRELRDLRRVKTYQYLVDAAVPGPQLRPKQSIAAADALFEDGMNYLKAGGHGVPLFYDAEKMKLALDKFNKIVRDYPTSDKIALAAFYCGEIYKEYFNDDRRALVYYRRAWEWDPTINKPARFQAAVVYDYRLHDRAEALRLYRQVVENETFNRSNVHWAMARIKQLTGEPGAPTQVMPEPRPVVTPASAQPAPMPSAPPARAPGTSSGSGTAAPSGGTPETSSGT